MSERLFQKTVATSLTLEGRGLHTGAPVSMTLSPAEEDTGIVFRVVQGNREVLIPAKVEFLAQSQRSTTLCREGVVVQTVEHFLAACWGWGISNVEVLVKGGELPGGDGSAGLFFEALAAAGVVTQNKPCPVFSVKKILMVGDERGILFAFPTEKTRFFYLLDATTSGEFLQVGRFQENEDFSFLAHARTFAFEWELADILAAGLGLGVREEALCLGVRGQSNHFLRHPQEVVFHKILDLLGDMMLLGFRIRGGFFGIRSGHQHNQQMVKILSREVQK